MKYRKKPVIIEAMKLEETEASLKEVLEFMGQTINTPNLYVMEKFTDYFNICRVSGGLVIKTLEGEHLASWGDYVIKGIKGEFYPCKPDIFKMTYEPAE